MKLFVCLTLSKGIFIVFLSLFICFTKIYDKRITQKGGSD